MKRLFSHPENAGHVCHKNSRYHFFHSVNICKIRTVLEQLRLIPFHLDFVLKKWWYRQDCCAKKKKVLFQSHHRISIRNMIIHSYREENSGSRTGSVSSKSTREKMKWKDSLRKKTEGCNRSIKNSDRSKGNGLRTLVVLVSWNKAKQMASKTKRWQILNQDWRRVIFSSHLVCLCHSDWKFCKIQAFLRNITRIYKTLIIKAAGLNMLTAKENLPLWLTSPHHLL